VPRSCSPPAAREGDRVGGAGLAAFEELTDPRLADFGCECYVDSGRHDQAIQLARKTIERFRRVGG
jgi:hypothetical protein